ncbi:GntR family transcriptional regulator [Phenylobacterium sp. LjRoot164]|uniref:GntR family transcriptional regulator n=1 Tax=unclassified Phenylobacterium TaxID=2640670 RepID=UPI003ECE0583
MDAFPISRDLLGKSASAYEHLRRAVSRGQLRPGRRLSATGLAAAFRISETPVREALLRLATEGFLHWEPNKGHFTKHFTLQEQQDLLDLIAVHLRAGLAAGRGEMKAPALPRALGDEEDFDHVAERLGEFGMALAAGGGNRVIGPLMAVMFDRTWLIRRIDLDGEGRRLALVRRAADLRAAIDHGQGEAAAAILDVHFRERRARLPQLIEAADQMAAAATYP